MKFSLSSFNGKMPLEIITTIDLLKWLHSKPEVGHPQIHGSPLALHYPLPVGSTRRQNKMHCTLTWSKSESCLVLLLNTCTIVHTLYNIHKSSVHDNSAVCCFIAHFLIVLYPEIVMFASALFSSSYDNCAVCCFIGHHSQIHGLATEGLHCR